MAAAAPRTNWAAPVVAAAAGGQIQQSAAGRRAQGASSRSFQTESGPAHRLLPQLDADHANARSPSNARGRPSWASCCQN
ncbi:hypothetical protein U9M48_020742 [Paspalum notatum var. saurae]|uniref:Uncharacterized protein n=1 Tax=Paspalum notatum var. saurae TaxID=547442 RepID=A0AAQ3WS15_PASNO